MNIAMGPHTNYYILIYNLIKFKDEFYRITDLKYQPLINELSKYNILGDDYDEKFPDNKKLATILPYSQPKMNKLLKEFYDELMYAFAEQPLIIKKSVCQIHIHLSYKEEEAMDRKRKEYFHNKSKWILMELPFIPRIGEEISFEFLSRSDKFYHGYVHNVEHEFDGVEQKIYIDVHPLDNYYFRWQKLKDEYEYRQRRDRELTWRSH
jgi:hypothetical protein